VCWVLFAVGSRAVSQWLGLELVESPEQVSDGNAIERTILTALIGAGLLVLFRRGRDVGAILRANAPLVVFFAYCAASVLWSDYPDVAFKRWTKAVGDLVMILVVLTEPDRIAAIKRFLARIGFLLIPTSMLLIKYFPSMGQAYSGAEGKVRYVGVTTDKNMLGVVCLLAGIGCVWRLIGEYRRSPESVRRRGPLIAQGVLLLMVLWLFRAANSMTSLACFLLASSVIATITLRSLARKRALVHLLVVAVLTVASFALFFDGGGDILEMMGRERTLTGRTDLWKELISMNQNPLVGTGFESFWLGQRREELAKIYWWRPNEAHNGYLEVYLNLGWIGVALIALVIATGYANVVNALRRDPESGAIRLGYFVAGIAYSFTEAAFRVLNPVWILFILAIVAVPKPNASTIRNAGVSRFRHGVRERATVRSETVSDRRHTFAPPPPDRRSAMRRGVWLIGLLILAPVVAHAQPWSGILSPERAIGWSGAGVLGGIPNRTTICATLNPSATAAQINIAIAACPKGQVVFLTAGTYHLGSAGILIRSKNDITLRGAGADQTKLVFSGDVHQSTDCTGGTGTGAICIRNSSPDNWTGEPRHTASWTAGYAKDTTVITLSSTTGLQVGGMLILDQLDDISDAGGIFVCTSRSCTGQGSSGASRSGRGQVEIKTVIAINGNQVTISPRLYMPNWRASQSPGAWWGDDVITGVGVEDLSIQNNGSATSSIFINNGMNCWVKGVQSITPGRSHIWIYVSARITVRDSYFWGTQNAASRSYGIETFPTSDSLIENNILEHVAQPIMMNGSSPGTVVGYNYTVDNFYQVGPTWMQPLGTQHDVNAFELFEGNDGQSFQSDNVHGTHHFTTLFRNFFYGDPAKDDNTATVHLWSFSRFFNIIGNVLGRSGYYNTYETNLDSNNRDVYSFGQPDSDGLPTDAVSRLTTMRWGNYDTVTETARFLATEVPTALPQFANLLPGSQALPRSFYLAAKPAWFGSVPWPAVGPDVVGGNVPGYAGHANKIPARLCHEGTPIDSAYGASNIRSFNASACYGRLTRQAPAAPSSVLLQ